MASQAVMNRNKGKFAADVAKLTSGTILAQVISLLAAPLITRLFSPQAFGIATLFTSITGILGVIVCLRYDRSIIVPATDEDAANLVGVSLFAALLITALSVPILFFGRAPILSWLKAAELGAYFWLIPLNVFLAGVLAALNSWDTRKSHFTLITIGQASSSVCYVVLAIGAGTFGYRSGGYLIGAAFVGWVVSTLILVVAAWLEFWPVLLRKVNVGRMLQVFHRYSRFPKYSTGGAILNAISWELPTFFLSGFFSTAVVGQYALGNRLIRLPMSFVGLNISRVFSQRAAEARHQGTLAPLVESTFKSLVTLGMFPFLLLAIMGKELFAVVFGARWAEAGVYTEILSIWAFFWFVSAPLTSVVDILEEQAFDLRMNTLIVVTRVIALLVGGLLGSPRTALGMFAATGVAVYAYFCVAIMQKSGLPASTPVRMLLSHLMTFVPYGTVILTAKLFGVSSIVILGLSVIALAVYYAGVVRTNSGVRAVIYSFVRRGLLQRIAAEL